MSMMSPFFVMMMFTLPLTSGNDLLDYVNTKEYWKTQKVEISVESMVRQLNVNKPIDISPFLKQLDDDSFRVREVATIKIRDAGPAILPQLEKAAKDATGELAARVAMLRKQLSQSNSLGNVRKLMAIRTLGELKKTEAIVTLKKLLTSKELFVADYAAAAIASIQGKAYRRPTATEKQLARDLSSLPEDCGVVAQLKFNEGEKFDIDKYMKQIGPMMGGFGGGGNLKQMFNQMNAMVISKTGNIRINSVTYGMAKKIGNDEGFIMFVIRGQYDRDNAVAAMKMFGKLSTIDGVPVISVDRGEFNFIFPSNQQLVVLGGPRKSIQNISIKQIIAGIKAGDGGLNKNLAMVKLVKTLDRKKDFWLAAKMNDFYREVPIFKPFDNIVVHATNSKGELKFNLEATGSDEEKIKATVKMMQTELQKGIKQFEQMAKAIPMFAPMLKTMKSIKMSNQGKKGKISMTVDRQMNAGILPFMVFGGMRAGPPPAQPKIQQKPNRKKKPQAKPEAKPTDKDTKVVPKKIREGELKQGVKDAAREKAIQ